MMKIQPMQEMKPLWSGEVLNGGQERVQKEGIGMFSDIFQTAIDQVKETDAKKNEMAYLLATGQLDNPAEFSIASQQALSSVQLLTQLRNKALEAYNELMRIGI